MKKRNILIGACVLVAAAGLWIALRPSEKSGITLETAPTERITIRNSVTATGTVEPVTEVEVGTPVAAIGSPRRRGRSTGVGGARAGLQLGQPVAQLTQPVHSAIPFPSSSP